jgi:hypothetical protein
MVFDARAGGIYHSPADPDVALATQRLAGIEHVAAFDDEIELVGGTHGRPGRRCDAPGQNSGSGRSRKGKKIAP